MMNCSNSLNGIEYTVVFSGRKSLALCVSSDGKVTVRAPYHTSSSTIERFFIQKEKWLNNAIARVKRNHIAEPDAAKLSELANKAKTVLPEKVAYYSGLMGLYPEKVSIGFAKTRFGCCSSKKHIVFSAYLMLYPDRAVDYVVVHELAHLKYMNHKKEFYTLIEKYLPDYKERAALLKNRD